MQVLTNIIAVGSFFEDPLQENFFVDLFVKKIS